MHEVTTVLLENEMDLVLANRQSMKLGELTGLGLPAQTTFATAVSEVARTAIDRSRESSLSLYITDKIDLNRSIVAIIRDIPGKLTEKQKKGYDYARKLVNNMDVTKDDTETLIELRFRLPATTRIDSEVLKRIRIHLNSDPEVSPYEEIKRKNRQLIEIAEMLASSENRYKDLTDSLPLFIYTANTRGRILYGNQWLQEYTGMSVEQLNENKWDTVLHPEDAGPAWKKFENNAFPKKQYTFEYRLKSAFDGQYRWHAGVATPVYDDKGNVVNYHTFMVDIHAQKMIEHALKDNKKLKETQAHLEEKITELNGSNQQLEQFAYVASHDLQEPLRKIGFYGDVLKGKYGGELSDHATMVVDNIIKSAKRMKALVHDILAYSTLNESKNIFVLTDLNHVAQEALQDLSLIIKDKNAQITIQKLPAIAGNAGQLKQLFENLLSNSLKYTRDDVPPIISVGAKVKNGTVTLSFKDNGIGFDPIYLDKMFHLFQRLHNKEKYFGTGIGLAICKKIVQMHGGRITAKSTPGNGAEFIITFPQ